MLAEIFAEFRIIVTSLRTSFQVFRIFTLVALVRAVSAGRHFATVAQSVVPKWEKVSVPRRNLADTLLASLLGILAIATAILF